MKYIIEGGHVLNGEINISGNKNAVFPTIAAALLTDEEVVLKNVPNINDTKVLVTLLQTIGAKVSYDPKTHTLTMQSKELDWQLPKELMVKLRGSIVLAGALLARYKKVRFSHPGGDVIGKRSIDAHLEAFKALGATVIQEDLDYYVEFPEVREESYDIFMSERSVTGAENAIVAATLGNSEVTLRNCATEPHVVDLCNMLVQMGVNIEGVGSDTLRISGSKKLKGTSYTIGVDFIEVGTYAVAAAITKGAITVTGDFKKEDLNPILLALGRFGVESSYSPKSITFKATHLLAAEKIITNVWPGFPTDMMSGVIVLATQAEGATLCHDWMYESRMFFVDKLISMGANITMADPHRVLIWGPTELRGRELETPDIRAGMALVLAGLIAKGQSVINRAELIERGYEDVVEKLKSLGAEIERVET